MNNQQSSEHDTTTIGRRNLLKAIGATGLAVTATVSLPGEWAKPVMDLGVLPAHAQASVTPPPVSTCIPIPTPADIMLTADMSGSMAEEVGQVKSALTTFVEARNLSNDKIGLLSFDTDSRVSQSLTQDLNVIKSAINSLTSGGSTSIAYGIGAAQNLLEAGPTTPGNQKIIVLFSDGGANQTNLAPAGDPADPAAAAAANAAADKAKAAGIRIMSVAVDATEPSALVLMQQLASSAGDFFYVENLVQLQQALSKGCQPQ